jgi:sugar lactone lactonase YvrE
MFNKKNNLKGIIGIALTSLFLSTGCSKKPITAANPYQQVQQGTVQQGNSSFYSSDVYSGGYDNSYIDPNNISTQQNNLPTGSVTGRVFDSLTGMGLSGARVEVMGIRPAITTITDASGNFTLPNVPQGRQVLIVTKQSYTNLVGNSNIVVNVTAGNTVTAPHITLVPDRAAMANGFVKAFDGFKHPRGIAFDRNNGDLYVVDVIGIGGMINYDRAEVKKINSDGGILDTFGSRFVASDLRNIDLFRLLQRSTGVGVDAGGNVYVADTGNNSIKKYGPNGRFLSQTKKFKNVFDLAVMTTGDIVVSDPGNSRVVLFDTSMNIKMENILGRASSDGIRGIATDNADNIYVVDTAAKPGEVVKKFDKNGNRLNLSFGIIGGLEPGYFNNPTDIAIDNRNGDIYVVDTGNNRVQRFNSEGNFLSEFGQFGSENGSFNAPWGIAIDNQGFVYVSDSKNARVQKFMPGRFGQNQQ